MHARETRTRSAGAATCRRRRCRGRAHGRAGADPLAGFGTLTREWFTARSLSRYRGAGGCLGLHRRRRRRAGHRAYRVRRDAGRVPVGAGPARPAVLCPPTRSSATGCCTSPAQGPGGGSRADLRAPLAGIRQVAQRSRAPRAGHPGGGAHRRTPAPTRNGGGCRGEAAGRPDHHTWIAVPHSDVEGARLPARRGHRRVVRCTPWPATSAALAWPSRWSGWTRCGTVPCRASPARTAAREARRIGLSATVRPPEEVTTFLGGARPVTIAAPPFVEPDGVCGSSSRSRT